MYVERRKFYILLGLSCLAGYIWIYLSFRLNVHSLADLIICPVKLETGIPCPSCGSTRALLHLFHGRVGQAILLNPIGIILAGIMIATPIWILTDLFRKKQSLFLFYRRFEAFIRIKWVAVIAVLLIVSNWIWNIYKGL